MVRPQAETTRPPAPSSAKPVMESVKGEPAGGEVHYRNTVAGIAYVGSEACAKCHQAIFDEYTRTPMGSSMTLPGHRPELSNMSAGATVFDETAGRYYGVSRKGNDYYQSEFALDSGGAESYRDDEKIAYAVGGGLAGVGYLVRRGNYLFEAPLSYYSTTKSWGLSPGFERGQLGFARPIVPGCIYCHSGRPQPVPAETNLYRNPPFGELAIGCENCHGPGGLHDREKEEERATGAFSGVRDTSIVNPANLSPWLANQICMRCHEFGSARVLQPGKGYLDFRPGTPLIDTLAIFKTQQILGWNMMEVTSEIALSKCYTSSGGRFGCLSCHDPHRWPTAEEAPAYYRGKCLGCHQETSCGLALQKRRGMTPADNCIACHMPKRTAPRFRSHGVGTTSHRVVREAGESYPQTASQPDSTGSGLILADTPPGRGNIALSPLVLLQAYHAIAHSHPEPMYNDRYLTLLNQLAKTQPDNLDVLRYLGEEALAKKTPEGAEEGMQCFSKAVKLGSTSPSDYIVLAELLVRSGRSSEAIELLKRGIEVSPYVAELYEDLSVRYWQIRNYSAASEVTKRGLQLFPADAFLRKVQNRINTTTQSP